VAKARANIEALRTLRALQAGGRPAGPAEQGVLARWSGWGALPEVFDEGRPAWAWARDALGGLLDAAEMAAASRSTINAHYTSAEVVAELWRAVSDLGFSGGRVLEPGCGPLHFASLVPAQVAGATQLVGVELDPTTAAIASALHPEAEVRAESFADTRLPEGSFDLAIGNVPFQPGGAPRQGVQPAPAVAPQPLHRQGAAPHPPPWPRRRRDLPLHDGRPGPWCAP